jgi:hypothetical protein
VEIRFAFVCFLTIDTKQDRGVSSKTADADRAATFCAFAKMAVSKPILRVVYRSQAILEIATVSQFDLLRRLIDITDHSAINQWRFSQNLATNFFLLALQHFPDLTAGGDKRGFTQSFHALKQNSFVHKATSQKYFK